MSFRPSSECNARSRSPGLLPAQRGLLLQTFSGSHSIDTIPTTIWLTSAQLSIWIAVIISSATAQRKAASKNPVARTSCSGALFASETDRCAWLIHEPTPL